MKKYIWLGIMVVLLGVSSALIWKAQSAGCPEYRGMRGEKISPADLSHWITDTENVLFEIQPDQLYIQEAIGTQGINLAVPQKIRGDFALSFDILSMTKAATITLASSKADGEDIYSIELQLLADRHEVKIRRGNKVVAQTSGLTLKPDQFYHTQFAKSGNKLLLDIDGMEVLSTNISPAANGRIELAVVGRLDNPAAIEIKNMILYKK